MVNTDGHLMILDFGIARATDRLAGQTATGSIKGTARYLSPEQLDGEVVGPESDLYSLGLCFFELMAGGAFISRDTVRDRSVIALIHAAASTRYASREPALRAALRDLGWPGDAVDGFSDVLALLLSWNPEDRIRDARTLLARTDDLARSWPPHRGQRQLRAEVTRVLDRPVDRPAGQIARGPSPPIATPEESASLDDQTVPPTIVCGGVFQEEPSPRLVETNRRSARAPAPVVDRSLAEDPAREPLGTAARRSRPPVGRAPPPEHWIARAPGRPTAAWRRSSRWWGCCSQGC